MANPDIVLITVDSLRADTVGFMAEDAPATPQIDAFAADSTLATTATAPSTHTRASVPSILTSQFAHRFFTEFLKDTGLSPVAELLSEAGYRTAAFHSNPLLSRHFGYDRGFDSFYDGLRHVECYDLPEIATRLYSKFLRLFQRFPYEPAEEITRRATDWLAAVQSPFFLWVHYMDPHGPYTLNRDRGYLDKFKAERLWHKAVSSPEQVTPAERRRLLDAYGEEVTHADEYVGELLATVGQHSSDTRIILTGDHGEEFFDHGKFTHMPKLYEELVQVPFILDLESERSAESVPAPISLLDVVPTLLEGIDGGAPEHLQGIDLHPAVYGGEDHRENAIIETNPDDDVPMLGIRTDRWKYIRHGDAVELYNLIEDPNEQNDRSREGLEIETELSEILMAHTAKHDIAGGDKLRNETGEMNDEMQDRLKDLGYL